MADEPTKECPRCGGTGVDPEGGDCIRCGGDGLIPSDFSNTVEDYLERIIAEQESQRTDLTAALSQIWNKVKDL